MATAADARLACRPHHGRHARLKHQRQHGDLPRRGREGTAFARGQAGLPEEPLPRVRQVMLPADSPAAPAKGLPAAQPAPCGPAPTLDEFLNRWRRGKAGLKPATEARLDDCLTMLRRYVDTSRPVTDYKPQDIRDYLAKARADKVKGRRRLKGQTINEAIWRPLHNAFALALEERFIDRNPMESVDREKTTPINRTQHNMGGRRADFGGCEGARLGVLSGTQIHAVLGRRTGRSQRLRRRLGGLAGRTKSRSSGERPASHTKSPSIRGRRSSSTPKSSRA